MGNTYRTPAPSLRLIGAIAMILGIASIMSVAGLFGWELAGISRPKSYLSLIATSCLTWLIIAPIIKGRPYWAAIIAGVLSPFLGVLVFLIGGIIASRPTHPVWIASQVLTAMPAIIFSWGFVFTSAHVTFPVGILTGLAIWASLRAISPNTRI